MGCDRCGRCCFEFVKQIHFLPDEPAFTAISTNIDILQLPVVQIYHRIKVHFNRVVEDSLRYYIPTKGELRQFLTPEEQNLIDIQNSPSYSNVNHECMFLCWEMSDSDKSPFPNAHCMIHGFHPKICQIYPESKGGLCRNHPERKYTLEFFHYQQKNIGFAIRALQTLYATSISDPFCFDILTLLMDFGEFSIPQLQSFFHTSFLITETHFLKCLDTLHSLQLISYQNDHISGISLHEIEDMIDDIMDQQHWDLPL